MEYTEAIARARETVRHIRYLETMQNLIYCDRFHVCPEGAHGYEDEVDGYVTELMHGLVANGETAGLVEYFEGLGKEDYASDVDRGVAHFLTKKYKDAMAVPAEIQAAMLATAADGQRLWVECVKTDDFESFKPVVERAFGLRKQMAAAIDPDEDPFQVVVGRVDEGLRTDVVDDALARVKECVMGILERHGDEFAAVDRSVLSPAEPITREQVFDFAPKLQNFLKFDFDRGVMYEMHHPDTVLVSPYDSRPSTNYSTGLRAVQSTIHETGHALYNYNSAPEVIEAGIWGGVEGAMHESQSRFYENMVGRSYEFWQAFYPSFVESVPQFADVDLDTFYKAYVCPTPGLLRLDADELTYALHIVIRWEMERAYFAGELTLDELEEAWNDKYEQYLGIRPSNRSEGILQDVHWASGDIGYFQSYTLGDAYAAQFRAAMLRDVPDAYEKLAQGDIEPINTWVREHVHACGQMYTVPELIERATGEPFNVQYYIDYLTEKFDK